MKTNDKKKRIIKIISALLVVVVLVSSTACTMPVRKNGTLRTFNATTASKLPETNGLLYQTVDSKNLEKVMESGLLHLYFDKATMSPVVYDTTAKKYWNALPTQEKDYEATVFGVTLFNGKEYITLNSQAHGVAFNSVTYTADPNGARVHYALGESSTLAQKSADTVNADEAFVEFTVSYTLKDGSFFAEIEYDSIRFTGGMELVSIDFLPYFGAYEESGADDFILVPDGSGAIIQTGKDDELFEPLIYDVYGKNDYTKVSKDVYLPIFGIKQGSSAVAAIIEKGDFDASIRATRKTETEPANAVNTSFVMTPNEIRENKLVFGKPSKENLRVCYRFLSGNNASYNGMAIAIREQFIRSGLLSSENIEVDENESMLFNLNLVGTLISITEKGKAQTQVATTYKEALDVIKQLKAKGVDNMAVTYKGMMNGGTNQDDILNLSRDRSLGSAREWDEFYSYTTTQNIDVFLDLSLASANTGNSFKGNSAARDGAGNMAGILSKNDIYPAYTPEGFTNTLLSGTRIEKLSDILLSMSEQVQVDGFSINDLARISYHDYSRNEYTKKEIASAYANQMKILSVDKDLITEGANIQLLKNADYITELPVHTQFYKSNAYQAVPLLQMILHGSYDYSIVPINLGTNSQEQMLKTIEYGGTPSFVFAHNLSDDKLRYDAWLSTASQFYLKATKTLSDLRDKRIKKHYQVSENLFCTEYSSGAIIYVNYSTASQKAGDVTVPARDFIRVN